MSGTLVNLIIQLVAGIIGGNAAGASLKDYNLGTLGNTIAEPLVELAAVKFCKP